MSCFIDNDRIQATIAFHGHSCPGLAIGIRAAEVALREFGDAEPGDLVAVVETDMCGVDAVQFLTGCTFGKGNLIHRDLGKMAFSFFHRPTGRGLRALLEPGIREQEPAVDRDDPAQVARRRERMIETYMSLPLDQVFQVRPAEGPPPRPPRLLDSLPCESCGESTMESRTRRFAGKTLCIPCFAEVEQKV